MLSAPCIGYVVHSLYLISLAVYLFCLCFLTVYAYAFFFLACLSLLDFSLWFLFLTFSLLLLVAFTVLKTKLATTTFKLRPETVGKTLTDTCARAFCSSVRCIPRALPPPPPVPGEWWLSGSDNLRVETPLTFDLNKHVWTTCLSWSRVPHRQDGKGRHGMGRGWMGWDGKGSI